jgi:hypothetical protein
MNDLPSGNQMAEAAVSIIRDRRPGPKVNAEAEIGVKAEGGIRGRTKEGTRTFLIVDAGCAN